jgi:hypothetical protein
MMLRNISGSNTEKVTGGCRKLHNDKLKNLYSSQNIISVIKSKMIRWAGHILHVREWKGAQFFVGIPEWRSPGRPKGKWEEKF